MLSVWSFRLCGIRCRASLLFPALLTAMLLCQPESMAVTCLLASLIHEGGHLLAMLLLRVPPEDCVLGVFGLRMHLGHRLVEYERYIWIALAGPATNGMAAVCLLAADRPSIAAVHGVLAVLNLLPVSVLDGGEILRCGLCLMGAERMAAPILRCTSAAVVILLFVCALWLYGRSSGNPSLLIVCAYLAAMLFFSEKNEKTS